MTDKKSNSYLDTVAAKEKGIEQSFISENNERFRIEAVRNRLLAIWVAEQMGKDSENIPEYILETIAADLEEPGYEDVIRKISADLEANGTEISREELTRQLLRCENEARLLLAEG